MTQEVYPKRILFNAESRNKMKEGMDTVANAVKVTLGAKGRNVVIGGDYGSSPRITKDGVSVARSIFIHDVVSEMGASLIKEVASKTVDVAGDGTTTVTVLAQALITEGLKALEQGANPRDIQKGMSAACDAVVKYIKANAMPINDKETLYKIALISANGDEVLAKAISEVIYATGVDGVTDVQRSTDKGVTYKVIEGLTIDRGYFRNEFAKENGKVTYEKPFIFITEHKISAHADCLTLIEYCSVKKRPLIIIADDFEGEALATIIANVQAANIEVTLVKGPYIGDDRKKIMEDIAIATGATVVSEVSGHVLSKVVTTPSKDPSTWTCTMLGTCESATITKDKTVLYNASGIGSDKLEAHIGNLKGYAEESSPADALKYKKRIALLQGKVGVVYIGGDNETSIREEEDRADDALHACLAALKEGYVAGGGVTHLFAAHDVLGASICPDSEVRGWNIVSKALAEPFNAIISNAGKVPDEVSLGALLGKGYPFGVNVLTEKVVNMIDEGIIDPALVSRVTLENAVDIAGIFLTTECVIAPMTRVEIAKTAEA